MDWDPNDTDTRGYVCPPCPVFYPTLEEFANPLKYISSIRHIGEQTGICKIVPPKGWQPPFAINERTFKFRTRVQQLNCIEGHTRAEGNFVESLRIFLYRQGIPLKELPRADGQLLNLHLLYKSVKELGGYDEVCTKAQWASVVRRVGRTASSGKPSQALCDEFKNHYEVALLAYERHEMQNVDVKLEECTSRKQSAIKKETTHSDDEKNVKRSLFASNHARKEEEKEKEKVIFKKENPAEKAEEEEVQEEEDHNDEMKHPTELPKCTPHNLEPSGMKVDPNRKYRLDPPEVVRGQKYYHFFPDQGAIIGTVKRTTGGKKGQAIVEFPDGSKVTINMNTMQILVANGWDADAAEAAYRSEVCQTCLRSDRLDRLLLCDSCNAGHHTFCLDPPLEEVPEGDWYCKACVQDSFNDKDTNPKFGFEMGAEYNLLTYKEKADAWKKSYFDTLTEEQIASLTDQELEKEYWHLVGTPQHEQRVEVEYGSDIDSGAVGSGFPKLDTLEKAVRYLMKRWKVICGQNKGTDIPNGDVMREMFSSGIRSAIEKGITVEEALKSYAESGWNLNNIPKLKGSLLQHLDEDIKGVMVPWIYVGMCFSTFCWHVEDHNFYSMSYLHCGAPKTWYGVPCGKADHFEKTMKNLTPELFGSQPDLHLQLVTMFHPSTLIKHGVPVYRATHRPNEFMVTFPSAYHGGFNNGFNCAEAVNFATMDWIPWGSRSIEKYRDYSKLPVFAHEALLITLVDTMIENNSFEYESARDYLLPGLEQMNDEFVSFEKHMKKLGVSRRESMSEFAAKYGLSGNGTRSVVSTRTCKMKDKGNASPASMERMSKMTSITSGKMGSVMLGGKMGVANGSTRMRMVHWAGRSGKNEGLRCIKCKQYCYLQAVACTNCHQMVGCHKHFEGMCRCNPAESYVQLTRFDVSHLPKLITSVKIRLEQVKQWMDKCDGIFHKTMTRDASKPSVEQLKSMLSTAIESGGVQEDKLDNLREAIRLASSWTAHLNNILNQLKNENSNDKSATLLDEMMTLAIEAEKLIAVPKDIELLDNFLKDYKLCREETKALIESVEKIAKSEMENVFLDLGATKSKTILSKELTIYDTCMKNITSLLDRMKEVGMSTGNDWNSLAAAWKYIQVLQRVNNMLLDMQKNLLDSIDQTSIVNPEVSIERLTHRDWNPLESDCRLLIKHVSALQRIDANTFAISARKCDLLVEHCQIAEGVYLEEILTDHSKSTEELGAIVRKVATFLVYPDILKDIVKRLSRCHEWEVQAKKLVDAPCDTNSNICMKRIHRPSLSEVEEFYHQADVLQIPTSSIIRRQLHSRLQDCRRWFSALQSMFLKQGRNDLADVIKLLHIAVDKYNQFHKRTNIHASSALYCICQQVACDRAPMTTCCKCGIVFHEQCLMSKGTSMSMTSRGFVCPECDQKKHSRQQFLSGGNTSTAVPLFCICRSRKEDSYMICCDFCDEWYHTRCIGMSPDIMNNLEAYRCQRCAIRQGFYYLDRKNLRKDQLGRKPALQRVEALLMQTNGLVAVPYGENELRDYLAFVYEVDEAVITFQHAFLRDFSIAQFLDRRETHLEHEVFALMYRITDLEVTLDKTQGVLGAIHWFLRACSLILGSPKPPKYSQLAVLLADSKQPNFESPSTECDNILATIEERVRIAALWMKEVKNLQMEEWNGEKAQRLALEYGELSQFLELPEADVEYVHHIVEATRRTTCSSRIGPDSMDMMNTTKKRRLV